MDLGGPRRRRSTPTRAATRRSCSPRPSGSGRPPPRRYAARTWSARSSPGCAAAPPARTAKPKFRIDAANELIDDEPPPRDRLELQRFATQRLGKDVIDVEDADLARGERQLLSHATWRLGPGDRVGIVGVNGAGKTSVLALLSGELAPSAGRVRHGRTVALQHLTQQVDELDPEARVLATIESMQRVTRTADGSDVTASAMLERFGFTGDQLTARLGDLSGGERRRFQLLRLLLTEPNVLLLDEPTNDLDIETLNVLEDFLDRWPGTLVVVSHDRYFLERVTDSIWALLGDGQISMLPRGVDEYLERRAARRPARGTSAAVVTEGRARRPRRLRGRASGVEPGSAEERAARKTMARIDKQLERVAARQAELDAEMAAHLTDYELLARARQAVRGAGRRARGAGAGVAGGRRARRVTRVTGTARSAGRVGTELPGQRVRRARSCPVSGSG